MASQLQIHPFDTLSAMLGLGVWKLPFPGFFAFLLVLSLGSSRGAQRAAGGGSAFLPVHSQFCQCCPTLVICPTSSCWLRPQPHHLSRICRMGPAEEPAGAGWWLLFRALSPTFRRRSPPAVPWCCPPIIIASRLSLEAAHWCLRPPAPGEPFSKIKPTVLKYLVRLRLASPRKP